MVSTLAGGGGHGFHNGPSAVATFSWPYGVTTSPDGQAVFVADSGHNRIRRIDLQSGETSTVAGTGVAGYSDGDGSSARFYGPRGLAFSASGQELYVADYANYRIRVLELNGLRVSTLTASGDSSDNDFVVGGSLGNSVAGGGKQLYRPAGVAVLPGSGNVVATDSANNHIRIFGKSSLAKHTSIAHHVYALCKRKLLFLKERRGFEHPQETSIGMPFLW
eukprot:gene9944-11775_t